MMVLLVADRSAQLWKKMTQRQGHSVTVVRPGTDTTGIAADVCLVVAGDPLAERFWFGQLSAPTVLVTSALESACLLDGRIPALRIICHPSRGRQALDDMLEMARDIKAGIGVFGRLTLAGAADART